MGSMESTIPRQLESTDSILTKKKLDIICIGAHPDDIEIGCGGTIQRLIQDFQTKIEWIVLSGSEKRKKEANLSAENVLRDSNGKQVTIKSFQDGFFPYNGDLIKRYFETIKEKKADIIFTHFHKDAHQDHRLTSELTWNTFRNHLILEYEIPKYDGDLSSPNLYIKLSREICEEKITNILNQFRSQREKKWFNEDVFWSFLKIRGMEANTDYAEGFYSRKIVL